MSHRLLLSLSLVSLVSAGCLGDQAYTPIGETEREDELCKQSNLNINENGTVALELDESGSGSYTGSLEVTLFSRTEMRVETEEVIVSVPANKLASFSIDEGTWDFFTGMVFAMDVREAGASEWLEMSVESTLYDIFWFTEVELNADEKVSAISSLRLCSTSDIEGENLELPFDFSQDYEVRLRAFPFEGAGDLVGTYDYTVNVEIH